MNVVETLAPIFLLIALGVALRKGGFLTDALVKGMNRMVYWVGLPTLLFIKLATATEFSGAFRGAFVIVLGGTIASMVLAYVLGFAIKLKPGQIGTFVHGSFRGNLAFVGLAVVFLAFSVDGDAEADRAVTTAILVMAPIVPLYNVVAVIVLLLSKHRISRQAITKVFTGILANPLIISCVLGGFVAWMGWQLPRAIHNTLNILGQFALPLALICIGGVLATTTVRGNLLPSIIATIIKTAVAPLVGFALARSIGATPHQTAVALIMLATPTAIASYILTDQLDGDGPLAASIVLVSVIASIGSLAWAVSMV